jgi:hypothetical protein
MSDTTTLADVEARFDLTHLDHLDRDVALPTVTEIAAQGDVLVVRAAGASATTPVPPQGVPVVRGENGGNTHLLVGEAAFDAASSRDGLLLGRVTVAEGATARLSHPEHGGLLLAPGTYEIRRQREQADEVRMVSD